VTNKHNTPLLALLDPPKASNEVITKHTAAGAKEHTEI
jgi:hypothetical protein